MSTLNLVPLRTVAGLAALAVIATACSSDQVSITDQTTNTVPATTISDAATTTVAATTTSAPPATDPSTTIVVAATTTEAATTTVAATTTLAPTTTTQPPLTAADLTLAPNGVQPLLFGDSDETVIDAPTIALGAPTTDGAQTYPIIDGDLFLDATEEEGFIDTIGRTVCFPNDLCAQFGGPTVDNLFFTGWNITSDAAPQLFTASGLTVGSSLADFAEAVEVSPGGCYWVGYGDADGVEITLFSAAEPFGSFDDDGNYVIGNPDLDQVSVLSMSAGELPYFLYEDC